MSLRLGDKIIAGIGTHTKYNAHSLLDFKWTDHILNEMSWLRADTFSWQDGNVYTSVYNLLVSEYQNGTEEEDIINGIHIWYHKGPNGYKIANAVNTDANITQIFNDTGVAWYYIIDTTNRRFKLPRTKYGFTGLRDSVGNYVPESLPNIKGATGGGIRNYNTISGALYGTNHINTAPVDGNYGAYDNLNFDASRSSSTYKDNAPVQQRATQMYLYFYVGKFSQTATEQTAGITTEVLNGKADVTLSNINASSSAKEIIVGWGMPDWSAGIDIAVPVQATPYICPSDGVYVFCFLSNTNNSSTFLYINGVKTANITSQSSSNNRNRQSSSVVLAKDDVIYFDKSTADVYSSTFYPLKGVN